MGQGIYNNAKILWKKVHISSNKVFICSNISLNNASGTNDYT